MYKTLPILFILTILGAAGTYFWFEYGCQLQEAPLAHIDNLQDIMYACEVVCDITAIAFVYLALRLMIIGKVKNSIKSNVNNYDRWALIRWAMLAFIIIIGEAVHYLFLSPSTVGCPIIGCLALLFVWPTKGRKEREIAFATEEPAKLNASEQARAKHDNYTFNNEKK